MSTQNVTLSINSKLYTAYEDYCKKKGLAMSQFEIMIENQMEEDT